ncbi:hypothetical protein B0H14DRAFT_2555744 [Mycena olivaceomarginata]|nr:hypothetical protein B0H14DRAFT_2555744 [Mycena olivaceomarginata]
MPFCGVGNLRIQRRPLRPVWQSHGYSQRIHRLQRDYSRQLMSRGFKWKTNEGHALAQHILHASPLLYDPHNYQIEGICCSLDSTDLLAITPTGRKKTGFYTISDTLRGTTDVRRDDRGPGVGSAHSI